MSAPERSNRTVDLVRWQNGLDTSPIPIAFGEILVLIAVAVVSGTVMGCDNSCEIDAIPSDCGADDEICDAETLTCEEQASCDTAEDCPGGYICYDTNQCARSCYRGFSIVATSYCKEGFTCTDDYRCVPE